MREPIVSNVRFAPARELDAQSGLVGWIACDVAGFHLDGLVLRRTRLGRQEIVYPARPGRNGRKHVVFRPIEEATEAAIARQIFAALEAQGVRA